MLGRLFERYKARKHHRFRRFVEAKDAYEAYINDIRVRFDEMTEEHYRRAREDTRLDVAMQGFKEAIELSIVERAVGDAAVAKYQLGMVCHARGELARAWELMHEALETLSCLPDRDHTAGTSGCHYHLGVVALKQGRISEAVRELRRSRQIDEANADVWGMHACDLALASCSEEGVAAEETHETTSSGEWGLPELETEPGPAEDTVIDVESKTRTVNYGRRELIWLASHSVEANDTLMMHLDSLGDDFGRPVSVSRVAFDAAEPAMRTLARPERDEHLCATVLVLEKAGLGGTELQELAVACVRRVLAVPDFRLLVYLYDLTVDELRELSDRDPMIAMLFDTTQIASFPSLQQLRRALVPFVRQVESIGDAVSWRGMRLRLAGVCGRLAAGLLVFVALFSLLGFPAWLMKLELDWLGPFATEIGSLVLGTLAFPVQAPLIFLFLRGMRTTVIAPQDSVVLMRWVIAGAVIMIGASHVQYALSGPHSWTFLGLAIGVVLDAIRRAGYQARRRLIDVETFVRDADDPSLQDPRETVLRGEPLNPFTCPLLPSVAARVFISYTRSSAKGSRLASALHDELRQAGASPFLDRATIPIGSSWRRSLNQHIGECDSIICILDEKGVQRKWVAAELLAAIEARRLTGTPYIVILMDPKVDRSTLGMLPVFRGVATAATEPPVQGRPLITQLNKQTLTSLVWGFAPGRFVPTAVLTRTLALSVRFVQSAMGFVGGFGILAGYVLGFLVLLERMGRFPVVKGLLDRGWLEPLTILVGFWLGFTARAAIAWGWESTHDSESGKTIPTIATIGLAFTFILLVPKTSIFVALWSTILVLVGWMLVGSVVGMTKDKNARVPRQA